jgi:hypothetical protein
MIMRNAMGLIALGTVGDAIAVLSTHTPWHQENRQAVKESMNQTDAPAQTSSPRASTGSRDLSVSTAEENSKVEGTRLPDSTANRDDEAVTRLSPAMSNAGESVASLGRISSSSSFSTSGFLILSAIVYLKCRL